MGQHWKCAGDTELWYHQLGRVDPPRPPAAAPYAADYAAKERHGPAGGASNDPKNGSRATSQSELLPSIIRWPRPSGSYENKEFMRYSKMDVLDFSYLFDTPMDAVLLNLGVHSYVLDPHVRQALALPPRFLCPADSVLRAGLRSDGGADPARG